VLAVEPRVRGRPAEAPPPRRLVAMRLLFAGTPAVAVPALEALLASRHEVVAVLTRADARSGRGRRVAPSAVRECAEAAGLEVITDRPRSEGFADRLAALKIDCAPVVAYGEILPREVLAIPSNGWVNLHFSVLPAWRGAAPVQRAIIAGDEVTGATTFLIEEGLDTGPVLGTATETIRRRDTAGDLLTRLSHAGAGLLVATLDAIEDGVCTPIPQPVEGISLAAKLTPEDARVTWTHPAIAVDRLIRGCTPAPGAWTTLPDGARLGLGPVTLVDDDSTPPRSLAPGQLEVTKSSVRVGTATQAVELGDVTPAGKKPMRASDWARGARLDGDVRLGEVAL
jgi:methionyl-tRNA formyltransferase